MADLPSPWARVEPGSRVKEGAPAIQRPTKEQIASFPQEANDLIDSTWAAQKPLIGQRLNDKDDNPFPRYDSHEAPFDEWMYEVLALMNDDESSKFYYENWLD